MALQMNWTDPAGVNYPTLYCRVRQVNVNYIDKIAYVAVEFWRDANAAGGTLLPVSMQNYIIQEPDWTTYFAPAVLAKLGGDARACAYNALPAKVTLFSGATSV